MTASYLPEEQGTLIFWDPIIQRPLTELLSLQWICSAKAVAPRMYDICLIAKVREGWYLTEEAHEPEPFAFPTAIRFAADPVIEYPPPVLQVSSLRRRQTENGEPEAARHKMYFVQRLLLNRQGEVLEGMIRYGVYVNEVLQPPAGTEFRIFLKDGH